MKLKVIIAGGREFADCEFLKEECDNQLSDMPSTQVEIVSGGARGADRLGERYAKEKGYDLRVFKADWDRFGKSAGILRNQSMAAYGDMLIAFWDGESRGTKNMIEEAKKRELKVVVCYY